MRICFLFAKAKITSLSRICIALFCMYFSVTVQAQILVGNVPSAFSKIKNTPKSGMPAVVIGGLDIPNGGHLQGIQIADNHTLVITGSSSQFAYCLTGYVNGDANPGIRAIDKLGDKPFKHAGGCQAYKNMVAVGVEDNSNKNKSEVWLLKFDEERHMQKVKIAVRSGKYKRSTAGATGITRTISGQYLIAVADWDSRNIDFYLSRPDNDTVFDSVSTFCKGDSGFWPSYQSVNLVTDSAGKTYLVGFALTHQRNRADLFEVIIGKQQTELRPVLTRYFKCNNGAGFRYGAGLVIDHGNLGIICCARNPGRNIAMNSFW